MERIVECVPNFSTADPNVIKEISKSIKKVDGVKLLNVEPDGAFEVKTEKGGLFLKPLSVKSAYKKIANKHRKSLNKLAKYRLQRLLDSSSAYRHFDSKAPI